MSLPFDDHQIAELAEEIDRQLDWVRSGGRLWVSKGSGDTDHLSAQRRAIAAASGEDPTTFLARFKRAAHRDLCEPGGLLHEQWRQWRDLTSKQMVKSFGGVLAGMGIAGAPLQTLTVALAVIVLHIGVRAVCEEFE